MRVDEVGAPGGTPRCARVRGEERRQQRRPRRVRPEVCRDAVAVRDAEVAEAGRRDHLDVDARRAQVLNRVADEGAGDVAFVPRIRRGEHRDSHGESQYARMGRRLPGWLLPAAGIGLPLLAVLVAILVLEPYYGVVDDAILLGYAQVAAADFPGEWADRVWSDISSWGMVRPFYWALAYGEYNAGAESPTALYVVNWAVTGAVLAFAGFAIARAFRVARDRLAIFLAVYGAAVFVYPWTLDLFAFPSYQEKWVVLAAALGLLWFAEPRERLPAWQWYAVSALVIGLGSLTKAQFVVFLPAFLLLVLDHRREGRASWSRVAAVTAMGVAAALALRVVAWHGDYTEGFGLSNVPDQLGSQVPLAGAAFALAWTAYAIVRRDNAAPRSHPDGRLRCLCLRLRAVAGRLPLDAARLRRRRRLRARRLASSLGGAGHDCTGREPRLGLHVDRRADGRALLLADEHRRVRPLRARPRSRGRWNARLHLLRGRLGCHRRLRAARAGLSGSACGRGRRAVVVGEGPGAAGGLPLRARRRAAMSRGCRRGEVARRVDAEPRRRLCPLSAPRQHVVEKASVRSSASGVEGRWTRSQGSARSASAWPINSLHSGSTSLSAHSPASRFVVTAPWCSVQSSRQNVNTR